MALYVRRKRRLRRIFKKRKLFIPKPPINDEDVVEPPDRFKRKYLPFFNFTELYAKDLNFFIFKLVIGKLTKHGNRLKAQRILTRVFYELKSHGIPAGVLFRIIYKLMPILRIIHKRVGGVIYRLPIFVYSTKIAISMAVKSLIDNSLKRSEQTISQKLIGEILDTHRKRSNTYKAKRETYLVATKALPFLHYVRKRKKRIRYNRWRILKFIKKKETFLID